MPAVGLQIRNNSVSYSNINSYDISASIDEQRCSVPSDVEEACLFGTLLMVNDVKVRKH